MAYLLARRVYLREQIKRHGVLTDATVVDVYVVPDDARSGAIPGSRRKIRFETDHPERSVWISDASSALPLA